MGSETNKQRARDILKGVPIIGRLAEVPADALREARAEIGWTTFFATMPFWFLPILGPFIFTSSPSLWTGIKGGELFVYAATLAGPLVYIITKRHGRLRVPRELADDSDDVPLTYAFPYARASVAVSAFLCILSGVVFTLQKLNLFSASLKPVVNETGLVWLSIIAFVISTILLFCVTSYRNMLDALSEKHSDAISRSLTQQEDQVLKSWLERRTDG